MKNIIKAFSIAILTISSQLHAQETAKQRKGWDGTVKGGSKIESQKSINNLNGGMPNRISMNVTVAKQSQGSSFGEKVNSGKLTISLIDEGCLVLFSSNEGYKVNTLHATIAELSASEGKIFGEKVNQGLHSAGSALSQGASLLGGALPGASVISAVISSVGSLPGGAATASYAKTSKAVFKIQDDEKEANLDLQDGEYELVFMVVQKVDGNLNDSMKTRVKIGFTIENNILKTKHDTVKNSVGNIR